MPLFIIVKLSIKKMLRNVFKIVKTMNQTLNIIKYIPLVVLITLKNVRKKKNVLKDALMMMMMKYMIMKEDAMINAHMDFI